MSSLPYALFVIAKDLSVEAINKKLQQAYSEDMVPGCFYLVTGNEYPVSQERTDSTFGGGTIPPVSEFTSSFSGKTIEEAADWLQDGPEWMFLDRENFAVLDENSEANDTITICRRERHGPCSTELELGKVQFYPWTAGEAGNCMVNGAAVGPKFDDYLDTYQLLRIRSGEPDLSRGKPYYR